MATLFIVLGSFGGNAFGQVATAGLGQDELQFYQLINQFRTALNLPALAIQQQLQSAAHDHSDWMTANNLLAHNEQLLSTDPSRDPFQRMASVGYNHYYYAGENVACGNANALQTFRQWAFSPGHLLNMINPHYHDMGIARTGPGHGTCNYFWTNDFGSTLEGSTDPVGTMDLDLITQAIVQVSGALPPGVVISLTEPTPSPTPTPEVTPPAPAPANAAPSAQPQFLTSIVCTVPYAVGRGILTSFQNTDTVIEATRQADGSFSTKLTYQQNGLAANIYPVLMNDLTMTRDPDQPVFNLISAQGPHTGGYSIEIDLGTGHAQFDSYGVTPQVTASLACTIRY